MSEFVLKFLDISAWFFGIAMIILTIAAVVAEAQYTEFDRLMDMRRGFVKTFPVRVKIITAIVCTIWIIARW
jgi:energy-converting hydrogenase Eha subunit H